MSNGAELSTSVGSEDAVSLASYYDNTSTRTSSSFEEQSDESESEHEADHEADIDKMLMDLEGFQVVRSSCPFTYQEITKQYFGYSYK